jgi:hypothetical protein
MFAERKTTCICAYFHEIWYCCKFMATFCSSRIAQSSFQIKLSVHVFWFRLWIPYLNARGRFSYGKHYFSGYKLYLDLYNFGRGLSALHDVAFRFYYRCTILFDFFLFVTFKVLAPPLGGEELESWNLSFTYPKSVLYQIRK